MGALLAGVIAALWIPFGVWLMEIDAMTPFWMAFLLAPISAALVGWWMARRVIRGSGSIRRSVGIAVLVVSVNSFVVSAEILLEELLRPHEFGFELYWIPLGLILGLIYGVIGLVFLGWLALVPALLSAFVWTFVMKHLFTDRATPVLQ
jgi:hypothetical protein